MPRRNSARGARRADSNPAPTEIYAARTAVNMTESQAAKVIYSTETIWKEWENPGSQRRMHPGLWELFLLKTGQLQTQAEWATRAAAAIDNEGNR